MIFTPVVICLIVSIVFFCISCYFIDIDFFALMVYLFCPGAISLFLIISFAEPIPSDMVKIIPNITVTEKIIVVESGNDEFILRQLSDRSILKAKAIYIQNYKNVWGIDYTSKQTLIWEY